MMILYLIMNAKFIHILIISLFFVVTGVVHATNDHHHDYGTINRDMIPSYNFLGYHLSSSQWQDVNNILSCWIDRGSWEMNMSHVIKDDIKWFAPCGLYHKPNHVCSWILDGNMTKYYWKESSYCHNLTLSSSSSSSSSLLALKPFSGDTMCNIMKSRGSIMVVGDSVSTNAINAWRSLWHRDMHTSCSSETEISSCYDLMMIHGRNDRISIRETDYVNSTENMKEYVWIDKLVSNNISLLVLNRGAHYEPDDKLIYDINQTMHYLMINHPNISIIWRNTPHGHLNFRSNFFAAPLKSPPILPHEHGYNYAKFNHQNMLVKKLLHDHYPRVLYLDAFTPTVLRVDSHPDPTHICPVGGHIETWLTLIYNALSLMKSLAG